MKKIFALFLAFGMLFVLAACGGKAASEAPEESKAVVGGEESFADEPSGEAYEITYASALLYTNEIGTVWIQTIIEVTNTGGADLFLSTGAYDLEDAGGNVVESRTQVSCFPDIISPGEKGYYFESSPLYDVDAETEVTVVPYPSVEAAKKPNTRFEVTDFEIKADEMHGLRARGSVENTSDEETTMTYVVCVLYNDEGTPIGLLYTILLETFAPGDKVGFEQLPTLSLPNSVTVDVIADYELYAYPMQMQF